MGEDMENQSKPGWKTSEWWGNMIVKGVSLYGVAQGFIPPQIGLPVAVAAHIAYLVARTWLKAKPIDNPPTLPKV
jgi:hypothetical protein